MSSRNIPSTDVKPALQADIMNVHTLSMFVANKPGVLGRICAVFSRRGFNIDSLVVSQGRDPRYSRMTVGISGHPEGLHQIIMQCNKLIDVIHCYEQNLPEGTGEASYTLADGLDRTVNAVQGQTVTFGTADARSIPGFTAGCVTVSAGGAGGSGSGMKAW